MAQKLISTSKGSSPKHENQQDCSEDLELTENDTDLICSRTEDPLPLYVLHEVHHFRQRFSWDCGLSCVLMLLSAEQRQYFLLNFQEICDEEGFGQSTWTIDLCYLLKRFDIPHTMYSKMLGVREEFKHHKFYLKNFEVDRERVQRRFSSARSSRVKLRCGALAGAALRRHVARCGPALALLDAGLLACDLCKHNKISAAFRRCFGGVYAGHYVLITGYNARSDSFLYRDPALRPRLCAVKARRLQPAREAPGTDHDIILIHRSYRST